MRRRLSLATLAISAISSVWLFLKPQPVLSLPLIGPFSLELGLNPLSSLVLLFVNIFGLLVCLYSYGYQEIKDNRFYFSYLVWLIASSNLVCLASDFLTLVFGWGSLLVLLYALVSLGSASDAHKALCVVGFGDFSLMLGVCLYVFLTGTSSMPVLARIPLNSGLSWAAFLLMSAGAFAKAGCGPLHTWIPTIAGSAPIPVMAVAPASLDKLLGIYLLARICLDFFALNSAALALLLVAGSLTILFAVIMALLQHDLRKLLAYHAVSQVGYMVLGIGTGTAIGIAGGIFHMVNNALYKSGLFFTGGSVGQRKKTFELTDLGGLAGSMPFTFAAGLVFALSISGIPPLNGFASKWMLYQGALEGLGAAAGPLRPVYLLAIVAAMFGSGLTLASFFKFIHAVFLGERISTEPVKRQEAPFTALVAVFVPALLCIALGALPQLFVGSFIGPSLPDLHRSGGTWDSYFALFLLAVGLAIGFIFWRSRRGAGLRRDGAYIGGEELSALPSQEPRFPATEFYRSIEDMRGLRPVLMLLRLKALDVFNLLTAFLKALGYGLFIFIDRAIDLLTTFAGYLVLGLSWVLRMMHTGILDFYLSWALLGLVAVFVLLMVH